LVVVVLGGVSSPGQMICCVLVLRRQWVVSFGIEQKLYSAPVVAIDIDTLHVDFLPEGDVQVI
jgi:hypothetical protein